jgi:hypothetical protein
MFNQQSVQLVDQSPSEFLECERLLVIKLALTDPVQEIGAIRQAPSPGIAVNRSDRIVETRPSRPGPKNISGAGPIWTGVGTRRRYVLSSTIEIIES